MGPIGAFFKLHFVQQPRMFQISSAYSRMVRSLENLPMRETLRIVLLSHTAGCLYSVPARSWVVM